LPKSVYKALTIAGSDSGAGAGIQADLKTFAALGVYGASAITAITAQNTRRVTEILELPPRMVAAQIDAVMEDIGADAAKTGMLANAAIIEAVANKIQSHRISPLVVDPVMVAKSGDRLLRDDAVEALRALLLPLATILTPNLAEAEALAGLRAASDRSLRRAAEKILQLGAKSVIIKGGHRRGPPLDLFFDGRDFRELRGPRIRTRHTHGTGCTFSAAIAAHLARGAPLESALKRAKKYVTRALRRAFPIGAGHGPVHHFHAFWR
jgi:hydroxymethylpyrimidine/phosphomethylpyrimidine kinase